MIRIAPARQLSALAAPLVATVAAIALVVGVSGAPARASAPVSSWSFNYTGGEQAFTVPDGMTTIRVTVIGGTGGNGYSCCNGNARGGRGAVVEVDLAVSAGQTLFIEVGGNGGPGSETSSNATSPGGAAGYNGGTSGGSGSDGGGSRPETGGGGGGASDIRLVSRSDGGSLESRLVVAGGGGGGGALNGGTRGGDGDQNGASAGAAGGGGRAGTATTGGAGGIPCIGVAGSSGANGSWANGGSGASGLWSGGGGGGGYYGGGGGESANSTTGGCFGAGGGGGGSSFASPIATTNMSTTVDDLATPRVLFNMTRLRVNTTPAAVGTTNVTSDPPGAYVATGSTVSLTATTPVTMGTTRYVFGHWDASPAPNVTAGCADDPTNCTVTLTTETSVTAVYTTQYQLSLAASPSSLDATLIDANPVSASGFYDAGTQVTLTADDTVDTGGQALEFSVWIGAGVPGAPNSANPLIVTMDRARNVIAGYSGTYTVCTTGCDYTTVNGAVADSNDGGTIKILDAVHVEWGICLCKNLTLEGQGADATVIDAAQQGTGVYKDAGVTATIRDLTITNGLADGGAIASDSGLLTISGVTLTGNTAWYCGGAIYSYGDVLITDSTITDNHVVYESGAGGAICADGNVTIVNSTITGNTADYASALSTNATATLVNTTVTGNTALHSDRGAVMAWGGTELHNSILAGNVGEPDFWYWDGSAVIDHSIVGVPDGLTLGDILDPAGLADHGGPTETIALVRSATNPAVDGGDDEVCAAAPVSGLDQRGFDRPAVGCDIGAYELQPSTDTTPPTTTIELSPTSPNGSGGWYTSDVGVSVVAVDADGTVDQTRCALDPAAVPLTFGDLPDEACSLTSISSDGQHTVYAASIDSAGNEEAVTSQSVNLDATKPVIGAPTLNVTSVLLNQTGVVASALASDATSGLAGSVICGTGGTATAGDHTVTCTATDVAGNTNSSTLHYTVEYRILGFFPPTSGWTWKLGSTVPIKIALADVNGVLIANGEAAALATACRVSIAVSGAQTLAAQCMRYDVAQRQFTFQWKLPKSGRTGAATLRATVSYPGTATSTTKTQTFSIAR